MNLFQKHPEDYDEDLVLYPTYDLQGVWITEPSYRLFNWDTFFKEQAQSHNCEIQPIFRVYEDFIKNMIYRTQTAFEMKLSFDFFRKLFKKKGGIYIKTNVVAHKLLVFSLIYSKYYGYAVSSVSQAINEMSNFPSPAEIHQLFKKVFVNYQYPEFIIENFEYLETHELHILMSALGGKNMKNHPIFLGKLTSHDFTNIMALSQSNSYTYKIFERAAAFVLMKKVAVNDYDLEQFVLKSNSYDGDPDFFLENIEFWQRGYQLAAPSLDLNNNIDEFYFIDYFERIITFDNSMTKLKKRTPQSLLRQVRAWHAEIYKLDNEELRKLAWEDQEDLPDIEFNDQLNYYQCKQLKNGVEVCDEGSAQKHCVSTYIQSCVQGLCRIWSLRKKIDQNYKPWITIQEVNKTIVQAKLKENEMPDYDEIKIIELWANKIGFRLDSSFEQSALHDAHNGFDIWQV